MKFLFLLLAVLGLCAPCGEAAPVVFREDFARYPEGASPESAWEMSGGRFVVRGGRLVSVGTGSAVAIAFAAPDLTEQTIEATISPVRRTSQAGWSAAGIVLFSDPGNFWRLSIVESPGRERYAELVEQHNDVWQAQTETGTRLAETPDGTPGFDWKMDQPYRMRLILTRAAIVGEVLDAETGAVRFRRGFQMPAGASAVRSGRAALAAIDMEAAFQDVQVSSEQAVSRAQGRAAGRYRIGIHAAGGQAGTLLAALKRAGFEVEPLSDSQIADNAALNPGRFAMLLLSDGARCPIGAKTNLLQFLRGGGDLLVVGGPLFERSAKEAEAGWERRLAQAPLARLIARFTREEMGAWKRGSNNMASKTTWNISDVAGPPEARAALKVDVGDLIGWDTLVNEVSGVFQGRDELTIFWAKGDARTPAMLFEWQEKDGSRWIASVPLTTEWKRYVLAPEDFGYWPDNPSKGRGGAGDRLNPLNVARMSIGLAMGNTSISPGRHTYWVAGIGAGRLPQGTRKPDLSMPSLEMFSPFYKYYRLPSLHPKTAELQKVAETGNQTGPVVVPIPRPRGLGTAGSRKGRWIPLADIRDETGRWRGARDSLYVHLGIPYLGSVWGYIAAAEKPADLLQDVVRMARGIAYGVFLGKAGAEYFSYFSGETVRLGAQVANFSPQEQTCELTMTVTREGDKNPAERFTPRIRLSAGQTGEISVTWQPRASGVYRVVTELRRNGLPPDTIAQEFTVLRVPDAQKSAFVTVKDGDFYAPALTPGPSPKNGRGESARQGGRLRASQTGFSKPGSPTTQRPNDPTLPPANRALKYPAGWPAANRPPGGTSPTTQQPNDPTPTKWYPYGVNYWQTNVAGMDPGDYYMHWLSPAVYDPEVVERDLTTLQDLGFTSVSIQLGDPEHVRQVNDFVFRAARHGIRSNLFLSGAHPFYTDEKLFTRLLTEGRFAGNPNLWAYDIAWEHHLGNHEERSRWDREWEAWVIEHYGTIAHAEQNWGFPIPRDESGRITNPPDEQLRNDGPWLKMAAAYERCADDVISRRYGRVIRKIRALDPNHLISARSASQPSWTGWFAYDLLSSGKHFDFSSPEGYGLNPAEGGFTVAYGRYAGSGKPVFWAEFGSSIYPYDTTGEKAAAQQKLHRGFAQMLLDSGASGLASWWSVGGYRVDEKSDYGIIAPDGTPRASARELKKMAAQVTSPRSNRPPSVWVTVDRDLHAAAYQAVYENNKKSYVDAVKQGRMVGVKTAGTGTTSANCPLTAVGNVPYDGFNPLKYLNGEFNRLEIYNAKSEWQAVEDGGTVEVLAGESVMARASVGNTGDAKWISGAPAPVGAVSLIGDDRPGANDSALPRLTFRQPLPDTARYADVSMDVFTVSRGITQDSETVFTFEAEGRARFGERRRVVFKVMK